MYLRHSWVKILLVSGAQRTPKNSQHKTPAQVIGEGLPANKMRPKLKLDIKNTFATLEQYEEEV